jgi:ubiquinone/menaquinone biosynthesis C-methylase UbiE
LAEFTGERVIPGEVDPDLWNEHVARYFFAARMARGRRVLDAGCGSGYGSAALAREAREVLGIDVAQEAIDYAKEHFQNPHIRFERASCLQIPASDGSFDLVVAFEIIEHLRDWRAFLNEVRRVLSPQGQFLVSTPNQRYYAETRAERGPNPFHVHEFGFAEFRDELAAVFPRVALYVENHTDAMVFTPLNSAELVDARVEENALATEEAHFFLAVCSVAGDTTARPFVYVPRAANMLRERERHIEVLESQLRERIARVVELQDELKDEQAKARVRIDALEAENRQAVDSATRIAGELDSKCAELAQSVEYLHAAERTVEERTEWALRTQAEADELSGQLQRMWATRWVRLGNKLRLLPKPEPGK